MKALLQRVMQGQVTVHGSVVGAIEHGFVILLGVGHDDSEEDIDFLVNKIINLRVFEDSQEKMNQSLLDVRGSVLAISQFTLYADCRKGRRPSFTDAADPEKANELYEKFVEALKAQGISTQTGVFGMHMLVDIQNDGPVTIMLDSKDK